MREEEVEFHYEVPGRARVYIRGKLKDKKKKLDIYRVLSALKDIVDKVLYNQPPDPVLAYKLRAAILNFASSFGLKVNKMRIETSLDRAAGSLAGTRTMSVTVSTETEAMETQPPATDRVYAV